MNDQFQAVAFIRASALSTEAHGLEQPTYGSYECSCGYGLGDPSGNLVRRFAEHLRSA